MTLQLMVGIAGFVLGTVLNYPMIVGLYSLWQRARSPDTYDVPVPWDSLSLLYFITTLVVKGWAVYTLFFMELPRLTMGGWTIVVGMVLCGSIIADLIIVWFQSETFQGGTLMDWIFHWCNLMVRLWEGGWMMVFAMLQAAALLLAGFFLVVFSV